MPGKAGAVRILGIDYGDRNIGLALSDPLQLTAQPLGQFRLSGEPENTAYFSQLIQRHEIGEIVVGFPLRMDGSSGTRAQKTRQFTAWLEAAVGLTVTLWDERLTTQQAIGIMAEQKIRDKQKKHLEHQISATLILQSYLDHRRLERNVPQNS